MVDRVLTGLGRLAPKTFNDMLAIGLALFLIPGLWVFSVKVAALPEAVLGATIPIWTMIAQFYFRKAPP